MVRHGRYITFQLAEVAVSGRMFGQILGASTACAHRRCRLDERRHAQEGSQGRGVPR
jgi:hypothetical protein